MSDSSVQVNVQGRVGKQGPYGLGTVSDLLRIGSDGALCTQNAHAKYAEATLRGNVFCASSQSVATFGTALTATAVTFTLYNPVASGKNLVILQTGVTVLTAGTGGHLVYAANVNPVAAIPATNTELTIRNGLLGYGSGVAKVYSVTTLPAAPVAVRTLAGAITAAGVNNIVDYVDGALVLSPNTAITIQGITIVGTGLISMVWEEVDIPT